jgi:hypothetical protein
MEILVLWKLLLQTLFVSSKIIAKGIGFQSFVVFQVGRREILIEPMCRDRSSCHPLDISFKVLHFQVVT